MQLSVPCYLSAGRSVVTLLCARFSHRFRQSVRCICKKKNIIVLMKHNN